MANLIKTFFDTCVLSDSVRDPYIFGPKHQWLKSQILAIDELHKLYREGKIETEYDLDVALEGRGRGSHDDAKIREKWGKPGPTWIGPLGAMPKQCQTRSKSEQRLKELKKLFRDNSLDNNHLVNAELYGAEYFVTTDRKLINKANNEGKSFLKIKVVSPLELLEIIRLGSH